MAERIAEEERGGEFNVADGFGKPALPRAS
jgi:hypothetical protein